MTALLIRSLRTLFIVLGCFFQIQNSLSYAQNSNNSLKQCREKYLKDLQLLEANKSSNQQSLVAVFNSNEAKRRQIFQEWVDCIKGQPIPSLCFKTISGESYDASSLTGKVVVINFWFIGCAPCRAEMPDLNKLVKEYKGKNVVFLGFANDPVDRLSQSFFRQNPFDFKIISSAGNIAYDFNVVGYPTTFVVDERGMVFDMWSGVGIDKSEPYHKAKAAIDRLLAVKGK